MKHLERLLHSGRPEEVLRPEILEEVFRVKVLVDASGYGWTTRYGA